MRKLTGLPSLMAALLLASVSGAALSPATRAGEGGLFDGIAAQMEANQFDENKFFNFLGSFPTRVLKFATAGKPSFDAGKNKLLVEAEITLDQEKYQEFIAELTNMISKLATEKQSFTGTIGGEKDGDRVPMKFDGFTAKRFKWEDGVGALFICREMDAELKKGSWDYYVVPLRIYNLLEKSISYYHDSARVEITDKDDLPIAAGRIEEINASGGMKGGPTDRSYMFCPFFVTRTYRSHSTFDLLPKGRNSDSATVTGLSLYPPLSSVKKTVEFSVSIEDAKRMHSINYEATKN